MKINAVFEGGGMKAIGLVGAVCEAERRGVTFERVAGTSSGSIVASLLAAGYSGEQMREIVESTPFAYFLKKTMLHRIKGVGPVARLFIRKGLYSGDRLEKWIKEILAEKGIHTFGDLPAGRLRIIASDISQGRLMVLPDDIAHYGIAPEQFSVARAIRMSTSIPFFFDPVLLRLAAGQSKKRSFASQFVYVVDGGVLSNFPLWLFDRENHVGDNKTIPTLGFQLVGKIDPEPRQIKGPVSMLQALFSTMMNAHDERFIEEHNQFRTIKIPTQGVGTTQFELSDEKKRMLYDSGVLATEKFMNRWSYARYASLLQKFNDT